MEKAQIRVGTWIGMMPTGMMEELGREIVQYWILILASQEIICEDEGKIVKANFMLNCAAESKQGKHGHTIMISKDMERNEFKAMKERISYIELKNSQRNMIILNVYAQAEKETEEENIREDREERENNTRKLQR